jgi:sulfur-oxidizing protein SoxB
MHRNRRDTLKLLTAGALAGFVPPLARAQARDDLYDLGRFGNVRILHQTDIHGQISPVYFREPSANLGVGAAVGQPPHLVGEAFLKHFGIAPATSRAYAFTYLDFAEAAHRYGPLGGLAHLKTLVDRLRAEAGPQNSLLLDGGDLWQGSWIAHTSQGAAMVALANRLGVDAMTAHWEFTYGEEVVRRNLAAFKGEFLAQNVFLTDEAAFDGVAAFDAETGRAFRPSTVREIAGRRIGIIGQCFPYQPIAHPRRFVSNWTFGIREAELQTAVDALRSRQHADAVILLSHNGMDVDLKLASRVRGIDVIVGGHTHDAVPAPTIVENAGGRTLVTNGGSSGKFLAVLDLDVGAGKVADVRYTLVPIFSNLLPADPAIASEIEGLRQPDRSRLTEKLADCSEVLYRRGNFAGTMDHLICTALRQELGAQIALSPGFRWGPTALPGDAIDMEFVLAHTAMTYPDVYVQDMTGEQIKAVLEDVCDNLFNPDPYVQQGGDMVRLAGLDYACDPNAAVGQRISALTLDDGRALDPAATYRVAGWASVNLPQGGKPVWEVVASYLRNVGSVKLGRINRVKLAGVAGNPGYAEPQ